MSNDDIFFYESKRNRDRIARAYFHVQRHISGSLDSEYIFNSELIDGSLPNMVTFHPADPYNGRDYSAYLTILLQTKGISKFIVSEFGRYTTGTLFPTSELYKVFYFDKDTGEKIEGPTLTRDKFNTEIVLPAASDGRILIGLNSTYETSRTINITLNPTDSFTIRFI